MLPLRPSRSPDPVTPCAYTRLHRAQSGRPAPVSHVARPMSRHRCALCPPHLALHASWFSRHLPIHLPTPPCAAPVTSHRPAPPIRHNDYLHIFNTQPTTTLRPPVEKSSLPPRKCLHRFSLRASIRLATLPVDKCLSGRGSPCDTRSSLRPQESLLHGYTAQARLATR